ncbi:MAG TPA: hypothetical protein VGF23_05845 [Gaiellaceae bacterium]
MLDRTRARRLLLVPLGALAAALAVAGPAEAHSRAPTVALDYHVRLAALPTGVRAQLIDGDRALRVTVGSDVRLAVAGVVGEPFLRFAPDGVWVDRTSPTAAGARLVPGHAGPGRWVRLSRGHEYTWHDHRLAPPPDLASGESARWSIPIALDGRRTAIAGTFVRVPRPLWWPWLAGAALAAGALFVVARRRPHWRGGAASVLAAVAAAAALAGNAAFATADPLSGAGRWLEVAAAAALALVAAAALLVRDASARVWIAMVIGAIAVALGFGSLSVFWHGVVISSLPAGLARLTTAVAVVAGTAAACLGITADPLPRRRTDLRPRARMAPR